MFPVMVRISDMLTAYRVRFHTILKPRATPTGEADGIPITYLDKGTVYRLNVSDTWKPGCDPLLKYRTFVRVTFDNEEARKRPAACWRLWKERRGAKEAYDRVGGLHAIEFVLPTLSMVVEDPRQPRVVLESVSLDGFCVTWVPSIGTSGCSIAFRFNFLSTDFSHSKGVRGFSLRLCAKTKVIGELNSNAMASQDQEPYFCKVKLFRNHGAKRKLFNDIAHMKKTIDKMHQKIPNIEMRDNMNRVYSGSFAPDQVIKDLGEAPKQQEAGPTSLPTSTRSDGAVVMDLKTRLIALQNTLNLTESSSVLCLRGTEEDDPELHPIEISSHQEQIKSELMCNAVQKRQTTQIDAFSVEPSLKRVKKDHRGFGRQQATPSGGVSPVKSNEWRTQPHIAVAEVDNQISECRRIASMSRDGELGVQIHSLGGTISSSKRVRHRPTPKCTLKPAACVYVQPRIANKPAMDKYHRAVYLLSRTCKDFIAAVAYKCGIEPTRIVHTVHIKSSGLHVQLDDEFVRELPEGQIMVAEFAEVLDPHGVANKTCDNANLQCGGGMSPRLGECNSGFELRLLF